MSFHTLPKDEVRECTKIFQRPEGLAIFLNIEPVDYENIPILGKLRFRAIDDF